MGPQVDIAWGIHKDHISHTSWFPPFRLGARAYVPIKEEE